MAGLFDPPRRAGRVGAEQAGGIEAFGASWGAILAGIRLPVVGPWDSTE
jgi:hypothetical protein